MALSLKNMQPVGASDIPPLIVLYGIGGIGKTTFGSEFPDVLYMPTKGERPPAQARLETPGVIENFNDVYDIVKELKTTNHPFKWLMLDAVDGLEPIIWRETCDRMGWQSIEQPGFGKGYLEADKEWQEFLDWMEDLRRDGMGVILLAHSKIVRFDSPQTDPYNRYTIKIQDRANALLREQADIVAFMNYKVQVREKEINRNKSVSHAEGGKLREIGLNTSAQYDAKNRYDMPDTLPYKKGKGYEEFAKYITEATGVR
ncbi:putative NTP-binding helicase protein [Rhizobium phage RHph_X2_26]|nr:putative NTP-binding helicase protein [Rhizobium phage RHph_X2_26]